MAALMILLTQQKMYKERTNLDEKSCKKLYRFNKNNIKWLADYFIGDLSENRGCAVSPVDKIRIFLRYVSDPGFQIGVGEDVGVHQSTVCRIIKEVTNNILKKSNEWIKFPKTVREINVAKEVWLTKFKFPYAIGVIDCTHVKINKPGQFGDEYINRKGNATLNIQATCDATEKFTSVDVQWPGSVHDSRILRNSSLFIFMNSITTNAVLLGDEGYGISKWLMVPFKNSSDAGEIEFNRVFTKERVIIERCFGQLKRRFPILHYKVRVALHNAPRIILCCFILHNIAKYLDDADDFDEIMNDEVEEITYNDEANANNPTATRIKGQERRNQIKELIINN